MARIAYGAHGYAPAAKTVADQRTQLRRAAELRLSGATLEGASCNPVDLRTPSFSRITRFDFADDGPVDHRPGRLVMDDDVDW